MSEIARRQLKILGALGALNGGLAVIAGAFAAHALSDARAIDLLDTGARWEAASGLAAILAALIGARWAALLHVVGAVLFAFSLYLLAAGAPTLTGAVTPLGGLAMIAGWAMLAIGFLRSRL